MKFHTLFIIVTILILNSSCKRNKELPPIDNAVDLDGTIIHDSLLDYPQNYLLSSAIPNPGSADLAKHIVIAAHGFSATTFEWEEFKSWAEAKGDCYVSIVLLGAHGRDYTAFKKGNWEDWQAPIIEEYNKLKQLGYKNISFVGSSTGCPLVLEMIHEGKIETSAIKNVFLIDPIILPSNKLLSMAPMIGPAVGYTTVDLDPGEQGHWYRYRPQHALRELEKLIRHERKILQRGVTLPEGMYMQVFKATHDDAADPASAVLLKKGVKLSNGNDIDVNMVNSSIHVFTRLRGRARITQDEIDLQQQTFETIYSKL